MSKRLGRAYFRIALLVGALIAWPAHAEPTAIIGATIIDGTGRPPQRDAIIVFDEQQIIAVGRVGEVSVPSNAERIDGTGKYVIPGLMDANVHLLLDTQAENLLKADGKYEPAILEAAQIALKNGVTTVFDTWGPRQALVNVRDRIAKGVAQGSRIFLAGNIIGFSGPMAEDFFPAARQVVSKALADKIDARWEQGVGPDLLWRTPEQVRATVRTYIAEGRIDFVKYAASGHTQMQLITFSPDVQRSIVEEAHRAGLTAQAHTSSVESLKLAIEAGVNIVQHCDVTGPQPIPPQTLKLMAARKVACAAFVSTLKHSEWSENQPPNPRQELNRIKDINDHNLIASNVTLLLATDAGVFGPNIDTSPYGSLVNGVPDLLMRLGEGHFLWLQGAVERGMQPMDALLAATSNIATAYGVADLGTLERGKKADILLLAADPLADVQNYRRIDMVIKDGAIIDLEELPRQRVLTSGPDPH